MEKTLRSIKFRAWDKKNKRMCAVDALYLADDFCVVVRFVNDDNEMGQATLSHGEYELIQFTGLHDRNGNEVFEGDVVEVEDAFIGKHKIEVEWRDGFINSFAILGDGEVIGNIYEHPNLLKN